MASASSDSDISARLMHARNGSVAGRGVAALDDSLCCRETWHGQPDDSMVYGHHARSTHTAIRDCLSTIRGCFSASSDLDRDRALPAAIANVPATATLTTEPTATRSSPHTVPPRTIANISKRGGHAATDVRWRATAREGSLRAQVLPTRSLMRTPAHATSSLCGLRSSSSCAPPSHVPAYVHRYWHPQTPASLVSRIL